MGKKVEAALVIHKSLVRIMMSEELKAVQKLRGGFIATLNCENRGKDWITASDNRDHRRQGVCKGWSEHSLQWDWGGNWGSASWSPSRRQVQCHWGRQTQWTSTRRENWKLGIARTPREGSLRARKRCAKRSRRGYQGWWTRGFSTEALLKWRFHRL